jgi:predicted O-methyltransferase YrrM
MDAPDIAQYFPHLQERVMPHSLGQPVLSDWADMPDDHELKLYKNCGFLNRDEAAILYQCVKQVGSRWLDIGAHTGWTALHMAAASAFVEALDPMFAHPTFKARAEGNVERARHYNHVFLQPYTSRMYFETMTHPRMQFFDGIMIDGDHCWGEPQYDAEKAFQHLTPTGVILLHDFIGGPVSNAVHWLMKHGMKCRVYSSSSQLLAVCWRGDFTPPDYTPDPSIDWMEYRSRVGVYSYDEKGGCVRLSDFPYQECV